MIREIIHVITNLSTGGAEFMLYKLLRQSASLRKKSGIVTLMSAGAIGKKIQKLGVPVYELNMPRGRFDFLAFLTLCKILRRISPKYVQTWMYHSDLLGGLAAYIAGCRNVIWGIHHSDLSFASNKASTVFTAKLCALLSNFVPSKIVSCSLHAKFIHEKIGYCSKKIVVIPNGFELDIFKPDPLAKPSLLKELGLSHNTVIVSLIGRFNPQKDHENFCRAASLVLKKHPDCHFVFCGSDVDPSNEVLIKYLAQNSILENSHLLGVREDMPRISAAADICVSSSCGEAFPLVVGEAMACETPCVVTDVGDSAYIVGETGFVVPPKSPERLAQAIIRMIEIGLEQRRQLGVAARKRVEENFSIRVVTEQYERLSRS
ncbi:MAG: hypothetical protein C0412_01265 [Flavobacterium sp.]|nr:hypothetical protein [Flavobacterium sp.]